MGQWIGSALVQIMACRLYSAKPLSKSSGLLTIGPSGTNFSKIQIKIQNFSFTKMHLNISAKWRPFCPGGDELRKHLNGHMHTSLVLVGIDKHDMHESSCFWWLFCVDRKKMFAFILSTYRQWLSTAYTITTSTYCSDMTTQFNGFYMCDKVGRGDWY